MHLFLFDLHILEFLHFLPPELIFIEVIAHEILLFDALLLTLLEVFLFEALELEDLPAYEDYKLDEDIHHCHSYQELVDLLE